MLFCSINQNYLLSFNNEETSIVVKEDLEFLSNEIDTIIYPTLEKTYTGYYTVY